MKIFVSYEPDDDNYVLMVDDGKMSPMPAGPRLLKAQPHPSVSFVHADAASAERDAGLLNTYLATLKKQTKKDVKGAAA